MIADYIATRTNSQPQDLIPQVAAHVSLALSLSAYEHWLAGSAANDADLLEIINSAMSGLRTYIDL